MVKRVQHLIPDRDKMREIEREELVKHLKEKSNLSSNINSDVVDFVLWKLNEIRHEVSIKLKEREEKRVKKSGA